MDELVAYNCDPNTEYNEVASLFLRDADTAIRQVPNCFARNGTTSFVPLKSPLGATDLRRSPRCAVPR